MRGSKSSTRTESRPSATATAPEVGSTCSAAGGAGSRRQQCRASPQCISHRSGGSCAGSERSWSTAALLNFAQHPRKTGANTCLSAQQLTSNWLSCALEVASTTARDLLRLKKNG